MPLVSVVIPVFNAEKHLQECIDSLLAQTLPDFEIICVDDGSTDGSLAMLRGYAQRDERVSVISQPNGGAGAARNVGIEIARGDYLLFLDADDFAEPRLLEATCARCQADNADIAVYQTRYFDVRSSRSYPADTLLNLGMLPSAIPFSYRDMPREILLFSSPAPWNKIYRRGFVLESGLRFQEISRTNDLFFTKCAFVVAERITVVEEALINYRIGSETNLQSANHETPLEFYEALCALRDELNQRGVLDEVRVSFANVALRTCIYNLNSIKNPETFVELFEALRTRILPDLGLLNHPKEDYFGRRPYGQMQILLSQEPEDYLVDELLRSNGQAAAKKRELRELKSKIRAAKAELRTIRSSRAYRITRRIQRAAQRIGGRAGRNEAGVN